MMIDLYILEFDSLEIADGLLQKVSSERKNAIENCINPLKKKQLLLSELLVRKIAKSRLDLTDEDIKFCKNERGKPYIIGTENFCYNVSHSKKLVVMAVSDKAIGVDVEFIRKSNNKLMDRCFSLEEQRYACEGDIAFFEVWTKKEAYIKSLGNAFFTNSPKDIAVLEKPLADNFKKFESNGYVISIYKEKIEDVNVTVLKEADVY